MIAATQCARAVAAPMGRTATVRVSTLVQTFAGYCAPRACEITTMSPCLSPCSGLAELPKNYGGRALRRRHGGLLGEDWKSFACRLQASVFTGTLAPAVSVKSTCASAPLHIQAR